MVALAAQHIGHPTNYRDLVTSGQLLPLNLYDKIIVNYSGGKDSLAMLLLLLEMGVPKSQIELWHQHVDGEPGSEGLMDWPCTEGYVRATGEALGITVRFQWKDGGFEGEMLRENAMTKGVYFEDGKGRVRYCPPAKNGKAATRRMFPQVSADLSVRWCSSYLKVDVAKRAINNDPRFKHGYLLTVTGERREESTARSKYKEVERHGSTTKTRRVDQWRAVIDFTEKQVWDIIARHRIIPHPAYRIGFGRVSCMNCIFADKNQWATIKKIAPDRLNRVASYEQDFGKTIKRGLPVLDQANAGIPFAESDQHEIVRLAMSHSYPVDQFILPEGQPWVMPAGAFKRCGGPL